MELDAFKRFLVGYVSAGHTLDDSAQEELENIAYEFVNWLDSNYLFTEQGTRVYIEFLDERLSDENRHWFPLRFDKDRYIRHLEKWIRHLVKIE